MASMSTVAIIGAGAAGLTAVKSCVDEGLRPTCYERTAQAGGVWWYADGDRRNGRICVSATTTTNTSKEMMAFSDFPMPKQLPNYMHHSHVLAYLHSYAETFDLEKYITYGREVTLVEPAADYDLTGRWTVAVKDGKSGEVTTTTFDAVIVCNGRNAQPNLPDIPGMGSFRGRVIHAVEHKDGRAYEGKRVVVVGMGNSGCDVAVDASRIASKVFLASRQGVWVTNKSNDLGLPIDTDFYRRANRILGRRVGPQFDHAIYGLKPKWRYLDGPIVISNELQSTLLCGYVTLKAGVTSVTDTSVLFADGTQEDDIDIIVCATGYNYSFPPLKESVCLSRDDAFQLYRWTFPPALKQATLAVVGLTPPLGPVFPELEIQSRWATRVFKGLCRLPDSDKMWREVRERRQDQVEYVTYMDAVATEIGCKPNIAKLLLTDPILGLRCYFGPTTAFQYRLTGPGRWDGAREAVLGSSSRMLYPMKTRYRTEEVSGDGGRHYGAIMLMGVVPLVALVAALGHWYGNVAVPTL